MKLSNTPVTYEEGSLLNYYKFLVEGLLLSQSLAFLWIPDEVGGLWIQKNLLCVTWDYCQFYPFIHTHFAVSTLTSLLLLLYYYRYYYYYYYFSLSSLLVYLFVCFSAIMCSCNLPLTLCCVCPLCSYVYLYSYSRKINAQHVPGHAVMWLIQALMLQTGRSRLWFPIRPMEYFYLPSHSSRNITLDSTHPLK
jgi:hypothetical protein